MALLIFAHDPNSAYHMANMEATSSGIYPSKVTARCVTAPFLMYSLLPDILVAVVYMSAKPISVEL